MNTTRALPAPLRVSQIVLTTSIAVSVAFLMACAPKYYSSNSQNVPLLTQAGEGSASASINPEANRVDVKTAVAVAPNFGLQANGALYFPRDEDSTGNGGTGGLFEVGAGYFRPLSYGLVFETYALAAFGGVENHFPISANDNPGTNGKLNANLVRVALQPAVGFKQRNFEAALSTRIGMLNYFNIDGNLVTGGENQQEYLRDHNVQFLAEPALTLRGGLDRIKIEAQLGITINMGDQDFPQDDTWSSIGIVYFFDPISKSVR